MNITFSQLHEADRNLQVTLHAPPRLEKEVHAAKENLHAVRAKSDLRSPEGRKSHSRAREELDAVEWSLANNPQEVAAAREAFVRLMILAVGAWNNFVED